MTSISSRLRELMLVYDVSRSDIEEKTGIGRSALSRYISGERIPRQDKIALIATAYNVDAGWLLGLDVPMKKQSPDDKVTAALFKGPYSDELNELMRIYSKLSIKKRVSLMSYAYSLEDSTPIEIEVEGRTSHAEKEVH